MPFDVISFAATKADLDNRGRVSSSDASSIAVVASMLGNPITSLLIGRSMADKKTPDTPTPQETKPVIDLTQPPKDGIDPATGAEVPAGMGQAFDEIHRQAQAFIQEARAMLRDTQDAARSARNAADEARAAALRTEAAALSTLHAVSELKGNGAAADPAQQDAGTMAESFG